MYPKRKAKSDRERFLESFKKKVGCAPDDNDHKTFRI